MSISRDLDFTEAQAEDLARYFLGRSSSACIREDKCILIYMKTLVHTASGATWREAFRAAGVKLPYRLKFSNVGRRVVRGADQVAICNSNSFAERTANALNAYQPDARGK